MNRIETVLVNSAPRRWLQRHYETRVLLQIGGQLLPGARALEIGCGSGYGTELIMTRFGAGTVHGVDLDPAMVLRARRRLAGYADRVQLREGSATDLEAALGAEDGSYDAVFDFAIIHHIPNWRAAIAEVARVLAPGGRFYFDEVTSHALARPSYRRLFDHPTADRFSADQFLGQLSRSGLVTIAAVTRIHGDYVLGVAVKPCSLSEAGTAEPTATVGNAARDASPS